MKFTFAIFVFMICSVAHAQVLRKRTTLLMGGRFDLSIVAANRQMAEAQIETVIQEIKRIENLISDWRPYTQIAQVNQNAGIRPVKVDSEVFALTKRALAWSIRTDGAFDISFAAMDKIWKFDGSMTAVPSAEAIRQSVAKVNYHNIILDSINSTIFLKERGMKIGFGALGEGYAANRCKTLMLERGIKGGIVNASGDMMVWGNQPNGDKWNIGITNPYHKDSLYAVADLRNTAVVTSGNYEKFVVFNGKRYSHIINPKTGYPVTGISSVTVFGPDAEMANGFSTSIMLLGKEKGLALIKQYPGYRCLIFGDDGVITHSDNLRSSTIKRWKRQLAKY